MNGPAGTLIPFARDELLDELRRTSGPIRLASPFLSRGVAKALAGGVASSDADDRRLLTAVTPNAAAVGALSPRGLVDLMGAGFAIRSIPNLHAKVSLADRSWGMVGSGNLTTAGLGELNGRGNIELGVRLTQNQIAVAIEIFDGWWEHPAAAEVTPVSLEPFLALEPTKRRTYDVKPLGSPLHLPTRLATPSPPTGETGLWVKAMYQGGKGAGEWWLQRTWIHDRHLITNHAMTRRPSYRIGDLIALYIVGPSRLPALLRVSGEAYDGRDQVRALYGEPEASRYGWVTPVEILGTASIDEAPTLDALGVSPYALQNGRARVVDTAAFKEFEASLQPVAVS